MTRPGRLAILHGFLIVFAIALIGKAAREQIFRGEYWAALAKRQHFFSSGLPASRGEILDAAGSRLVESQERVRIAIAPNEARDLSAIARAMRSAGIEEKWIRAVLTPGRKWVEIPTLYLEADVAPLLAMRGVHPSAVVNRIYPNTGGLRRITGRIDRTGRPLDGIELSLDSLLRGDSGSVNLARDKTGRGFDSPETWGTIPQPGHTVSLTINSGLQEICERALASAVDSLSASGGDIVVMNPHTGEVLAMASKRANPAAIANTAITEPFEPGSTLKPFVAAALLAHQRARTDEIIDTYNGKFVMDGRTITDVHKADKLSLADVIRFSSNVGIVRFSQRLTAREKYEMLRDMGFGTPTGIPLPAEAAGTLREPARWSNTSAASLMMGYEIAVTPLQLVTAYSAIANGGELLEPLIIKDIRDPDGEIVYRSRRRVVRRVMPAPIADSLQKMLLGVVQGGTAVKADLVNFQVAGKSGTARRVEGGRYLAGNYTASFVGLFPADKPQYVVLVKLDSPKNGYYGGDIAAPVTRHVLRAALAARDAALDRGGLLVAERRDTAPPDSLASIASKPESVPAPEPKPVIAGRDTVDPVQPATIPKPVVAVIPSDTTVRLPLRRSVTPPAADPRPIPFITGMTLRDAVRAMHAAGFRVALSNGSALAVSPAPGTLAPAGSLVRISRPK
jgi:cell division protein FtsI (penicillin-binding protein 3)